MRNLVVTAGGVPVVAQTGPIQAPGAAREPWGDPLQSAFIRLDGRIGRGDRVLVRLEDPKVDISMVYWWSTYWLYPRDVRVTAIPGETAAGYSDLVFVNTASSPPPGWPLLVDENSGGLRIRAYHRPAS